MIVAPGILTDTLCIRPERPDDAEAVREVLERAFGQQNEADLVDALRAASAVTVTLVAEAPGGRVVGHVLFSPITMAPIATDVPIAGLGPLAVLPEWQCRGVGSRLVPAGLEACRAAGMEAVVVLGHSTYYPRFGFQPAARFGIRCEYDVPDPFFMALELKPGALDEVFGIACARPEFHDV